MQCSKSHSKKNLDCTKLSQRGEFTFFLLGLKNLSQWGDLNESFWNDSASKRRLAFQGRGRSNIRWDIFFSSKRKKCLAQWQDLFTPLSWNTKEAFWRGQNHTNTWTLFNLEHVYGPRKITKPLRGKAPTPLSLLGEGYLQGVYSCSWEAKEYRDSAL